MTEAGKRRYYGVSKKNTSPRAYTAAGNYAGNHVKPVANPNYPSIHQQVYDKDGNPLSGWIGLSDPPPHAASHPDPHPHSGSPTVNPNFADSITYISSHADNKKDEIVEIYNQGEVYEGPIDKVDKLYQKQVDQKVKEFVKNVQNFNLSTFVKSTADLLSTMFKTDNPFGYLMNSLFKAKK